MASTNIADFMTFLGWEPGQNQFNITFFANKKAPTVAILSKDGIRVAEEFITKNNGKHSLYVSLNPLKSGTKPSKAFEGEVQAIKNVYIDIDRTPHVTYPKTDYPASNKELDAVSIMTGHVLYELETIGIKAPFCDMTGNGYRIIIPVTLGLTKEDHKAFLYALQRKFKQIDTSVWNPDRVTGIPGTINVKSHQVDDRVNRMRTDWQPRERVECDKDVIVQYAIDNPVPAQTSAPSASTAAGTSMGIEEAMTIDDRESDGVLRRFYNGDLGEFAGDRSKAEISLCDRLVFYNFTHSEIETHVCNAAIGKARDRGPKYYNPMIDKAFAYMTERYVPIDWGTTDHTNDVDDDMEDWTSSSLALTPVVNGFIADYLEWTSHLTDGYTEYQYVCALSLLGAIIGREQHYTSKQETIYPNLYALILGYSTMTRKSTAVRYVEMILRDERIEWFGEKMPTTYTPQALVELLHRNSQRIHIVDECGSWLKSMNSYQYMKGMKEDLISLYGCEPISRMLAENNKTKDETDMKIDDPFLSLLYATTPESFYRSVTIDDVTSGFMARFLVCNPEHERGRIGAAARLTKDDDARKDKMIQSLADIIKWSSQTHVGFTDEALSIYDAWMDVHETRIAKTGDRITGMIIGRTSVITLKIAMLLAISEKSKKVTRAHIEEAIRQTDTFWLYTAGDLIRGIESSETKSNISRIISLMNRRGGVMTQRQILRGTNLSIKQGKEALDTMIISGAAIMETPVDKGLNTSYIYKLRREKRASVIVT